MSELSEQIRETFSAAIKDVETEAQLSDGISLMIEGEQQLVPGFTTARTYYVNRLLAYTRRGYRWHAGSDLPHEADQLVEITSKVMMSNLVPMLMEAYADGVLIGHQDDHIVKMFLHFNAVEHLFDTGSPFLETAKTMAKGFAGDEDVRDFFAEYLAGGLVHMSHLTGFAHQDDVDPNKVWDIWMLIGSATVAAAYVAGHRLGVQWKEKDLLSSLESQIEEGERYGDQRTTADDLGDDAEDQE